MSGNHAGSIHVGSMHAKGGSSKSFASAFRGQCSKCLRLPGGQTRQSRRARSCRTPSRRLRALAVLTTSEAYPPRVNSTRQSASKDAELLVLRPPRARISCCAGTRSRCCGAPSGGYEPVVPAWVAWRDSTAVWQELAGVVEYDDAIAQQAPPLLGVRGDGASRCPVRAVRWDASGPMRTHDGLRSSVWRMGGPSTLGREH
jgi:hypothetical protein